MTRPKKRRKAALFPHLLCRKVSKAHHAPLAAGVAGEEVNQRRANRGAPFFLPEGPHFSGTAGTLLKYASNAPGPDIWTIQTVATLAEAGSGCDIAVATDGTVRIVYVAGDDLMHAHGDHGSWTLRLNDR